jgi:hypothetical protein
MESTHSQHILLKILHEHVMFWMHCNDLENPTNYVDIEDSRTIIMEEHDIPKPLAEMFTFRIMELLNFIRDVPEIEKEIQINSN